MFPPKKPAGGPPMQGAPGKPPGMDLLSMLGGGMGGGMPMPGMGGPMGGSLPPMPGSGPGMPRPGMGMNAMSAMQGGIGMPPSPAAPPAGVNGPGGLPVGATDPGPGGPDQFGGSDLLSMLSQGGDPYDQPPGQPSLEDVGTDPTGGMGGLMSMLAMASMGVDPNQPMGGMPGGMGGMPGGMGGPMPY